MGYNETFVTLKNVLISTHNLWFHDFSLPFIQKVDSSLSGHGSVLSQIPRGKDAGFLSAYLIRGKEAIYFSFGYYANQMQVKAC